jgi:hypothetical protein
MMAEPIAWFQPTIRGSHLQIAQLNSKPCSA